MTVYRIVWIMPSGDEIPDVENYPSATEAILMAFRIQGWIGKPCDFEVGATRLVPS